MEKEIGGRIKALREKRKMSREQLASKAGITSKFLYEVENGKKGLSAKTLCKIAAALSCSCDYILLGVTGISKRNGGVESLYTELVKDFDERQQALSIKILESLLENTREKLQ